jgi:hypothetical protein
MSKALFPEKAFVYTGLTIKEKEWLWIYKLKFYHFKAFERLAS